MTFPRKSNGLYLRTVEVKKKADTMYANDILQYLRHPVPPPPSGTRSNMCLTTTSGSKISTESDAFYAGFVESMSPLPLNQASGEIEFGMKSIDSSKCDVLAAAAFTPLYP